jgi:hypothetical protein
MSTDNMMVGLPQISGDRANVLMIPSAEHEVVNCKSGDVVPSIQNCRFIYSDIDGIVKFDYLDVSGNTKTEVMAVNAGTWYPVRNVVRVYQYYTGTTAITSGAYGADGVSVEGIKLRR